MGYNTTRHEIGVYTRLFPMIFFWVIIFVTLFAQRKKYGDTLTFKQGFQTGLIMTLVYCAGFTVMIILYQNLVNPEYYQTLKDFTMKTLEERKATQAMMDAEMKELQMSQSGSASSYLLLFVFSSIWGIGISAIASALLRKK